MASRRKDSRTPLSKSFDAFVRKFHRGLAELGQSAVDHTDRRALADKLYRAIDRDDKWRRGGLWEDDPTAQERFRELRRLVSPAFEEGGQNYRAALEAESARLSASIREDRAKQGGYEKELELMRGRR